MGKIEHDPKDIVYFAETKEVESKPGCWNVLDVFIYEKPRIGGEPRLIGQYRRNYHSMMNTFVPFMKDGKWYALYSDNYTRTAVMELPSCKQIAKEEPSAFGFCPTGFYVPWADVTLEFEAPHLAGHFGFVCGCVWGDDTSWKIEYLDLSHIEEGVLVREPRFGYIELLGSSETLPDAVEIVCYDEEDGELVLRIACAQRFVLNPE